MHKLNDLFIQQLRTIYSAEQMIANRTNSFNARAVSKELKDFFFQISEEKRRQLERLDLVFKDLDVGSNGETNEGIESMLKQSTTVLDRCESRKLYDVTISLYNRVISGIQVNSYQMVISCAVELGEIELTRLLRKCLREEKRIEKQLGRLEEEFIEELAKVPLPM